MTYSNGKAVIDLDAVELFNTSASVIEESPLPAKRKDGGNINTAVPIRLDIDAGAKRVKCRLNGVFKSFPSEAKDIKDDVPLRSDGCFSYNKKHYVVGSGVDRVNGNLIVGSQDNKINRLDVWVLGAITHYRTFLKTAAQKRRRKTQPVQLALDLRVVTLSSPQRRELDKALKAIEKFVWEDVEFAITVKSCEFIDEGEGAALEVVNLYNLKKFYLLDLGGGTITFTAYEFDGSELSTISKTPISGGGMSNIINKIFKALTRTDRGAIQAENIDIELALERSEFRDDKWYVPLRSNGQFKDISDEVQGALSEWVQSNYAIQRLFDWISQKISKDEQERVFCSGGGFAVKIIADWIIRYLLNGVSDREIVVLNNPQDVNLAGLHHLDKSNQKGEVE